MNILITGTSSGIGKGLALEYLKRKNNVFGISRRTSSELKSYKKYYHLELDLTNTESTKSKLPAFIKDVPKFDLVILNAGILGNVKLMSEIGVESMQNVMNINVWSNKLILDILYSENKTITQVIGISSKASLRSSPGWGPYSMSKASLNMLMNIYAAENSQTHFTAFAPGLVDSEIQETIWNIKETNKYPTCKRIQDARYTEDMPSAEVAAPMLIKGIEAVLQYESGNFYDVRDMNL